MASAHLDSLLRHCGHSFPHLKQLQAYLLTSGHFLYDQPLRSRLIEACALHPAPSALPHALAMLRCTPSPATNDLNACVRGLAAGANAADALRLLVGDLVRFSPSPPRFDALTISFSLKACARALALEPSSQLHARALRLGVVADVKLMTTLLDAYAKCGDASSARKVFDEMTVRDIASWNALLNGLAVGPEPLLAIRLFTRLRSQYRSLPPRERPNDVTLIAALSACTQLGALKEGVAVHEFARECGLGADAKVKNALIDMYSKCGELDLALGVFRSIPESERTIVSYNAAIMSLAMHGRGHGALELFDEMPREVQHDAVTYLSVLSGCNHAGLVDEGLRVFESMQVEPNIKHYGAIVDLLGRAGRLMEAYDKIMSMPFDGDVVMWQTMLANCKMHGDMRLAEIASTKLDEMGSNTDGDYVLLSNTYAAKARWGDVKRVRDAMKTNDVNKVPGFSYMYVGEERHKFINGDKEHMQWRDIYRMLEEVASRISELGYVPETSNVLHDIGEEEKRHALNHHSEKLAIAFGLIATPPGEMILVFKNLRICGDCHVVGKLISKAYGRIIVVRDRARFHRFEGGECSCGDYW